METLQRTANRGSISTGFDIDNSLKIEPDNSESMSRTPSGNGNLKTCTLSVWLKRTELKDGFYFTGDYGGSANPWFILGFNSNEISLSTTAGVSANGAIRTSRLFRDTSAWYHIVVAFDTTQSTASNRVKIYVNGVQETSLSSANYPDQNDDLDIMAAKAQGIGGYNDGTDYRYAGYMSEFVGIDGQALAPTEFGEFNSNSGIWIPKDVSGLTFGTNGFYLDFKDASNLGNDASGGTDFAETNIAAADQATDTPTNNFSTFNPLILSGAANISCSNGNTNLVSQGDTNGWRGIAPSIAVQSGKWYVEFTAAGATTMCGVGNINDFVVTNYYGNWNTSIGFYGTAGLLFIDGATSGAGPNNTWTGLAYGDGDIVGIALDKDNGCVYMSKNGTFANSGDPTSGASKTGGVELTKGNSDYSASDYFYIGASQDINSGVLQANYGGYTTDTPSSAATDANGYGTFEYAPPTGYYALCTKNLAEYG